MRIFCMEIKRILLSRRNQIFIIAGLLISLIVPVYSIHSVMYRYTESDGTEVLLRGLDAIRYRNDLYSDYDGEVTTEKLEDALSQYQTGVTKSGGLSVDDESFPNDLYQEYIAPVRQLTNQIEEAYTIPSDGFWTWTPLEQIPAEEMSGFYDKVENYRYDIIDYEYGGNQSVIDTAQKLSQRIERPFQTYGAFTFESMEFFGLTIFLLIILCGAIAAPAFSENYENGSDYILRCTKYGRIHFSISKLSALFTILAVFYLVCTGIHIGILNTAFGWESLHTSVQMFGSIVSLVSMNIGQLELIIIFGGLLTLLSTVSLIMFISSKLITSFATVLIAIVLIILPLILYFIIGASWIVFIFPSSGVGLQNGLLYQLTDMNFITFNGTAIWPHYLIFTAAIIELFVFLLLSIRTYCKHQVL